MKALLITCVALLPIPAGAQIHISGPLSGFLADTTYIVDGAISIADGDSLIIEAGSSFLFSGNYDFDVYGYLCAVGNPQDSITFGPYSGVTGWGGIDLYAASSDSSLLAYLRISGSASTGFDLWGCAPRLEHCTIRDNHGSMGGGVCLMSGASPTLFACQILNNTSNYYGGGIGCYSSSPIFLNCLIASNTVNNNSTSAYGGGAYCSGGYPQFLNCEIIANQAGTTANGLGGGLYFTYSDPTISGCLVADNAAGELNYGDGGGLNCVESDIAIDSCTFANNSARAFGGGVYCDLNSQLTITNTTVAGNSSEWEGGGLRAYQSSLSLLRCVIDGNSSGTIGGGIRSENSTLSIINSTISGNSAAGDGGGLYYADFADICNSIVHANSGNGGIYCSNWANSEIRFSDFFANQGGNFRGVVPPNLGQIVAVNANGDSCDAYGNIFFDPLFYSLSGDSAFHLTTNSPCIDAGDPSGPFDPDSTVADQGAYFFDQSAAPPLLVYLTPLHPPIQIPPLGGRFTFDLEVTNNSAMLQSFDLWTEEVLPNGHVYGPIFLREDLILAAGLSILRPGLVQSVPGNAPAGGYSYVCKVGEYPDSVIAADQFPFVKLGGAAAPDADGSWMLWGWMDGVAPAKPSNASYRRTMLSLGPNPANPFVVASFELRVASNMSLDIFDICGRKIAELASGFHLAGEYRYVWDAGDRAAGMYIFCLKTGVQSVSEKLVIVK
ncbi:MAG TPA: hypothetical protein VF398_02210 [bacterium]